MIKVEIFDVKTGEIVRRLILSSKEFEIFRQEFHDRYIGMDWRIEKKTDIKYTANKEATCLKCGVKIPLGQNLFQHQCWLKKPDMNKPVWKLMPEKKELIKQKICPMCGLPIFESDFRDELSKREYSISGLCQKCQDKIF